jgi:hypothetical protein
VHLGSRYKVVKLIKHLFIIIVTGAIPGWLVLLTSSSLGFAHFEITLFSVECLCYDGVLELDHGEENLIESALSIQIDYIDVTSCLTNPVTPIFSLQHHCWGPMHLCK